jgi:hypothetical protein
MSYLLPTEKKKPEFPDLFTNPKDSFQPPKNIYSTNSHRESLFKNKNSFAQTPSRRTNLNPGSDKKNYIVSSKKNIGQSPHDGVITPIKIQHFQSSFQKQIDLNFQFGNW